MSEIREKVKQRIGEIMREPLKVESIGYDDPVGDVAEILASKILAIPELAVVDREADPKIWLGAWVGKYVKASELGLVKEVLHQHTPNQTTPGGHSATEE